MSHAAARADLRLLAFLSSFRQREGRSPTYSEMEGGVGYSRAYLHRMVSRLTAAGKLRQVGIRGNFELVGETAPDPVDLRECLLRLKNECEIEGLSSRPGFDAWLAWANRLLGTEPRRAL